MAFKKFRIGDALVFDPARNTHYPKHDGHGGRVVGIQTRRKDTRVGAGTIVTYAVQCGCGSVLHPQGHQIQRRKPCGSS